MIYCPKRTQLAALSENQIHEISPYFLIETALPASPTANTGWAETTAVNRTKVPRLTQIYLPNCSASRRRQIYPDNVNPNGVTDRRRVEIYSSLRLTYIQGKRNRKWIFSLIFVTHPLIFYCSLIIFCFLSPFRLVWIGPYEVFTPAFFWTIAIAGAIVWTISLLTSASCTTRNRKNGYTTHS